jgi:TolB-like protein
VEPPPPVAAGAPDAPPALAALVMRCLLKDPAQRPQSADELLQLLQAVGTPVTGTASFRATPRRRRWGRLAALAAAGLLVAGAGAFALAPSDKLAVVLALARRAPPQLHPNRVIVAPFANETGDPRLASLGAMAADWLSRGLTGLGGLEVVDARTAAVTGEVVDRIPWPLRARDRGRALAEETGAGLLVSGVIYRDGDSLRVQARMSDAATGKLLRTLSSVSGPASAPTAVLDQLNRRVVANVAQAMDTIASSLTAYSEPPSIEAYEEMRGGIAAYLRQDSSVFTHFERAIALDSTYATPVVLLAFSRVYRGYPEQAAREVTRARRLLDRIAPADRAMLAHVEAQLRGDAAESLRAAQEFVRITPGSSESPLLLASIALSTGRPRLALDVLRQSDPDRGLNLGGPYYWRYTSAALLDLGRHQQALDAAEQGLRRFPKNVSLLTLKGRALVGLGRVRELDDLIDATPAERGERVAAQAEQAHALAAVLRASGEPAAAAALAGGWLRRVEAARDSAARAAVARMWLLVALDRWDDAAAQAQQLDARTTLDRTLREDLATVRAAAAARRGQRAVAQQIELELAGRTGPYDLGRVSLLRARIAAHLGERNRAAALFQQALGDGLNLTTPLNRFRYDPLLFPLLGFPAFEGNLRPVG